MRKLVSSDYWGSSTWSLVTSSYILKLQYVQKTTLFHIRPNVNPWVVPPQKLDKLPVTINGYYFFVTFFFSHFAKCSNFYFFAENKFIHFYIIILLYLIYHGLSLMCVLFYKKKIWIQRLFRLSNCLFIIFLLLLYGIVFIYIGEKRILFSLTAWIETLFFYYHIIVENVCRYVHSV